MRWRTLLGAAISLGLLAFAISFLVRIAQQYKYEEIVAHLHELPWWQIGLALAFTIASYLLLTCYDLLAVLYLRRKLAYRRIALASFVGYTFSHNLGFALLTGSSVRYRLYSLWGLTPAEIAQLVMFCSITFFLGLFAMGGIALLYAPPTLPAELLAEKAWMAELGDALFIVLAWAGIACALAYLAIPLFWRRPLLIRGVEIRFPGFGMSVGQLIIAGIDWILACGVLYALLPPETRPDFLPVLTIFMAGNILGVMLHVPGGIGVFEAVVTALLSPVVPTPQLLGALVAYRVTYYVLPFVTALLLFGGHEVIQFVKNRARKQPAELPSAASRSLMAPILAMSVFAGGAILMFSSVTPTSAKRLIPLTEKLPLYLLEASHLLAALAAVSLLLVARSLLRHSRNGFDLATKVLPLAALFAIGKGLQYEVAIFLLLIWLALLPSRHHFTRRRSVARSPFGNAWLMAIGSVIAVSIWLTYFSYRHVPTDLGPWWQVAIENEQARSYRALLAFPIGFVLLALVRLLRPSRRAPITSASPEHIQQIIQHSPTALGQLGLLGDKHFVISAHRNALLMYVAQDRSLIALGDPIGPDAEHEELLWQFRELCDQHRARPVVFMARPDALPRYFDLGLIPHKLGEEAVLDVREPRHLGETVMAAHAVVARSGLHVKVLPAREVAAWLPQMKEVSDDWLASRATGERGFAVGHFDANYLMQLPHALVFRTEPDGGEALVAFASLLCGGQQQEFAVDLLRHRKDLPADWVTWLHVELLQWGRRQGYRRFCLGLVPVQDWTDHPLASLWNRIGRTLFLHSRSVEKPEEVRQFKQQFAPHWEERYLMAPSSVPLSAILADVSDLMLRDAQRVE